MSFKASDIPIVTTEELAKLYRMFYGLRAMYGAEKAYAIMEDYAIDTKPLHAYLAGNAIFFPSLQKMRDGFS